MRVGPPPGQYVGIGLGDNSAEVEKIFAFYSRKFKWVRDMELSGTMFTDRHQACIAQMQANYIDGGKLRGDEAPIRGVINKRLKEVSGYLKAEPRVLPIVFTVEGHMSDMFIGPCASTASWLEQNGICHWKPVGDWDTVALPFKNHTGVEALFRQLNSNAIEGPPVNVNDPFGPKHMWPFPPGTPWGGVAFSQGAMIFCEFMWKYVLPREAPLHYRLKDFRRGLMFGNPRRATDAVCPWAHSPPDKGTHGIMDRLFDAAAEGIGDRWAEHPNDEDLFAEVGDDSAGKNQTAIAKIITENQWFGGQATIFARIVKLFGSPVGEGFAAIKAAFDAIMFLAKNPNPHYSTYATAGDIDWMRGIAA